MKSNLNGLVGLKTLKAKLEIFMLYAQSVKKSEVEMAEFLEALKAPQSRRILEKLAIKDMSLDNLIKNTKFSERSIQLHLEPLIKAKLVSKSKDGLFKVNWSKFNRNAGWFKSISDSEWDTFTFGDHAYRLGFGSKLNSVYVVIDQEIKTKPSPPTNTGISQIFIQNMDVD